MFVGTRMGWPTELFAAIDAGLACMWFGFVVAIGMERKRRSAANETRPDASPMAAA